MVSIGDGLNEQDVGFCLELEGVGGIWRSNGASGVDVVDVIRKVDDHCASRSDLGRPKTALVGGGDARRARLEYQVDVARTGRRDTEEVVPRRESAPEELVVRRLPACNLVARSIAQREDGGPVRIHRRREHVNVARLVE